MTKHHRSYDEIKTALDNQLSAIAASCEGFDNGNLWEANRIATAVYVILADSGRSKSLLGQLGIKEKIWFLSSSHDIFLHTYPKTPLLYMFGGPYINGILPKCYLFHLDQLENKEGRSTIDVHGYTWDQWYEEPVIVEEPHLTEPFLIDPSLTEFGKMKSRKQLVNYLRSQDGGAHYDGKIDKTFKDISTGQAISVFTRSMNDPTPIPLPNVDLFTMRQIAWEVLITFEDYFSGHSRPETSSSA